jgi:carbon starvation protein
MGILIIMIIAAAGLLLAGRYYAPVIARVLGEKADRPTPAVTINDGVDYVPTRTPVVFAHHFASIAGAGPIIGPVLALIYGWGPALAWIILGGMFLGAVHDFVATHVALREGGKSITVTAKRYIGKGAFILLLILLVAILGLVCACFLDVAAKDLSASVAAIDLQMSADQTLFQTDTQAQTIIIGGIASTSVIVITVCSPLIGFFYLKRRWPVWICSFLSIGICAASIWIGFLWPLTVSPQSFKWMLSIYVLLSAGLPVWLFLQSRDFINVHLLYVGIAFMFVALIAAGFRGGGEFAEGGIPFNNIKEGNSILGLAFPFMFITIACGAVSGFHSLCAGGTTCKQLPTEIGARQVGFYGMLLESFFSVCVVCALLVGLSIVGYKQFCYPDVGHGNWVLAFAMGVGHTVHTGLSLPVWVGAIGAMLLVEGFVITTLDTAIRLTRYLIEEGWSTFFARYDVFAENEHITADEMDEISHLQDDRGARELAGTGGMHLDAVPRSDHDTGLRPIRTTGMTRAVLQLLKNYWVNSGIAVGLMLALGIGSGYLKLWKMFGASNQLLAALALLICTTWLYKRGRPIKYTLIPALFMLVTATSALVIILFKYMGSDEKPWPLMIADVLVLVLTTGICLLTIRSWKQPVEKIEPGGAVA